MGRMARPSLWVLYYGDHKDGLALSFSCRRNLLFPREGFFWQPIQSAFLSRTMGDSILEVFLSSGVSLIRLVWIWLVRWLMLHKADEHNRTYPWQRRLNPWFSDHSVVPFLEFVDRFQQRFRWFGPDPAKGRCGLNPFCRQEALVLISNKPSQKRLVYP